MAELTKEQIEAALAANADNTLNLLSETLKSKEYNVIPKSEYNNFLDQERSRIASEKTAEIYSGLDKDIAEASGLTKDAQEKTYDFAKRVINQLKTQGSTYSQKIAELEDKINAGSTDETLKAQLETYRNKEAEWQEKLSEKDTALFQKDVNIQISNGLSGIKFKKDLPESLVKIAVESAKNDLLKTAKTDANGNVFFTDEKGQPILDDKTQVATADYILKERLKDVIDTGRQQGGAGTGGNGGSGGNGGALVVPEGLKSRAELSEFLIKNGKLAGSKEHNDMYAAYMEKYPNLPLR